MKKILGIDSFRRKMKELHAKRREEGGEKTFTFTKDELLELIDKYDKYKGKLPKKERRIMSRWLYGILGALLVHKISIKEEDLMERLRKEVDISLGRDIYKNKK